jgi:uncharacterized protein (DUF2235 family)
VKRIVICADGTWNDPEAKDSDVDRPLPTNVLKTSRAVLPHVTADGGTSVEQITYYHPGVGTHWGLDRLGGGMLGFGLERNVRDLYRFIVYNWEPGDELYLFGFSRGSYTIRVLAGFMERIGLVQKSDEYFTHELFKLYRMRSPVDGLYWQHQHRRIKNKRACPTIHFMGLWDCVRATAFNRNMPVALNNNIKNVAHACATDENRRPFMLMPFGEPPEEWRGSLQEVWFAGAHCGVGGSNWPDKNANIALFWMLEQAGKVGLRFDYQSYLPHYHCYRKKPKGRTETPRWYLFRVQDSMKWYYRLLGRVWRGMEETARPTLIHQSVFDRRDNKKGYRPPNLEKLLAKPGSYQTVDTERKL